MEGQAIRVVRCLRSTRILEAASSSRRFSTQGHLQMAAKNRISAKQIGKAPRSNANSPSQSARSSRPSRPTFPEQSQHSPSKHTPANSLPRRGMQLIALGGFILSGYMSYLYVTYTQAVAANEKLAASVPVDTSDRYVGKVASNFDDDVGTMEFMMGLNSRRSHLARQATGHVLEVSCGTGRNMKYYRYGHKDHATSITFVDQSQEMLEIAEKKFKEFFPPHRTARFLAQSAQDPVPMPAPGVKGFDTIVETMGLCSTGDPVGLLQNLGKMANQETGRILLLEHGRGHYAWLNKILDNLAPGHADRFGCWWNKDIGEIVQKSGLEVVELKRYNFGTTWWIELRPPRAQK